MKKLQECYDREWFKTAPMYIVGMKNTEDNWVRKYDNKPHGDIDMAIAAEHLCLAATERGLGTCWVCAYDSNKMKELFPREGYEAVVIIPLGHMAEDCPHNPKNRKAMNEIIEEIWVGKTKYQPGKVVAVGYKNGKRVLVETVETTKPVYKLVLSTERQTIKADGQDLAVYSWLAMQTAWKMEKFQL